MAGKVKAAASAAKESVFGSWFTSIIGILFGAAQVIVPIIQNAQSSGSSLHAKDYLTAAGTVLLGLAAKQGGKQ